jgi:PEP-CTERM motif
MIHRVSLFIAVAALLLCASNSATADTVNIGTVSFDLFILSVPGAPGSNIFDIGNLTGDPSVGGNAFPPSFPVFTSVNFNNVDLVLTESNGTVLAPIALGTIGPGSDFPNSTIFSDSVVFADAVLTGTLSPTTITFANGGLVQIGGLFSATITPSSGNTLTPGVDSALISVSTVPEPPSVLLMGLGLLTIAVAFRKKTCPQP